MLLSLTWSGRLLLGVVLYKIDRRDLRLSYERSEQTEQKKCRSQSLLKFGEGRSERLGEVQRF